MSLVTEKLANLLKDSRYNCKADLVLVANVDEESLGLTKDQLFEHRTMCPSDLHLQNNHLCAFGWLWYTVANPCQEDAIYYPSYRY